MATRKPLVRIGGKNQQLPAADTIDVPGARFHEGDTEPTIKSYGDRWLHGSMAIEYTWVDPGVWVDLSEPTAADVAAAIHAATGKTTPVDADELGLSDSEASWSLKKLTWANLKAVLLAYFTGQFREKLTAGRTYYVRTDGNDSNDGLTNTSGGAFLTLQKAVDVATSVDVNGNTVTISVGDGTYAAGVNLKPYSGGGIIVLSGNVTTPSSCVISISSGTAIYGSDAGKWAIQGFRVSSAAGTCLYARGVTQIFLQGLMEYGASSRHMFAFLGAEISVGANWAIVGGAGQHMHASYGGRIFAISRTCTLTGTPSFSSQFAYSQDLGAIQIISVTFSGSATGSRYSVVGNSVIQTGSAGATYFPGNSAGASATGGQYI